MNKHILLLFMIFCYLIPIYFVYYHYKSNNSLSNILCYNKNKYLILFFMVLMGLGSILYEFNRNDKLSIIIISLLLIGIYGAICVNTKHIFHYIFTFIVFIAILFFMIRHCFLRNCNTILILSLFLAIFLLIYILMNLLIDIKGKILISEIIYILNFAFFYLYLHFMKNL